MKVNQSNKSESNSSNSGNSSSSSSSSSSNSTGSSTATSYSNDSNIDVVSNFNQKQLTPISAGIQKSLHRTKLVIDRAHLDYLNRIMDAKAQLSCELKTDLKQRQQENIEEINRMLTNEQNVLTEKMERSTSPQQCYRAISEYITNLKDIITTLAARQAEETDRSKNNIIDKHKQLIQSNQYKLQDLHERFIVPMRNSIQCVSVNSHLPNVGDTIEIQNGVFDEKFGRYKQYLLQDDTYDYDVGFSQQEAISTLALNDTNNNCGHLNNEKARLDKDRGDADDNIADNPSVESQALTFSPPETDQPMSNGQGSELAEPKVRD